MALGSGPVEPEADKGKRRNGNEEAQVEGAQGEESQPGESQPGRIAKVRSEKSGSRHGREPRRGRGQPLQPRLRQYLRTERAPIPKADQKHRRGTGQDRDGDRRRDGPPPAQAVSGEDREIAEGRARDDIAESYPLQKLLIGQPTPLGDERIVVVSEVTTEARHPDERERGEETAERDPARGVGRLYEGHQQASSATETRRLPCALSGERRENEYRREVVRHKDHFVIY